MYTGFMAAGLVALWVTGSAARAAAFSLKDGTLSTDGRLVLQGLPDGFSMVPDATGNGVFLRWKAGAAGSTIETPLGTIPGLRRFTSTHRDEPFWMLPKAGSTLDQVSVETQWLLAEVENGSCVMVVPLFDNSLCFSLLGGARGLVLRGETADPAVKADGGVALYVAAGDDPYTLAEAGAKAVMQRLGTGKLRRDKPLPDFVDQFGWCTWDSFYKDVSADGVRKGLMSFAAGGVEPRFMILDDGWQDYKRMPSGEDRLVSLAPNVARFKGDLTPTVRLAKQDFKIKTFLVWHAIIGYWGGVDGSALAGYGVKEVGRSFSPALLSMHNNLNTQWWGHAVGVIPPEQIGKFYNDYHDRLKAQGVDGVKVDNQSMLEGVAAGMGGRLALTQAYRKALEQSVASHFDGRLINCMANAQETYYCAPQSTLMRTSIDFFPKEPASHGQHLYTNSQVGMWFGQFMQPDWDMFQSAHAMGAFHAAGRAVSGGPVYVSDTPEAHDFGVLQQLVLSDGSILRADNIGRPTRDCLFAFVTHETALLKIFNYNRNSGVIGIFNVNYHAAAAAKATIEGTVAPADAPDMKGQEFAAFFHEADRVWHGSRDGKQAVTLEEGGWEIVAYAPVERGVAILGLADKYNGGGAVMAKGWVADGSYHVALRDGGQFVAWVQNEPKNLEVGGKAVEFKYDAATGRLSATLPASGTQTVVIRW